MGAMSRRKGCAGELEVAKLLGVTRNARNGQSTADLALPDACPYHVEVKRWGRANMSDLYAALDQATTDAPGKVPVVAVRTNGKHWLVVQWIGDAAWLKQAVTDTAAPGTLDTT